MISNREELLAELIEAGRRAVDENPRHSTETLWTTLGDLYPEVDDELLEVAVLSVLP
jgi:hypothetical protein